MLKHQLFHQRNLFLHRICWDPQKEPAVIVNSAVKWLSKIEHNNKIYKYINEHALANELEKRLATSYYKEGMELLDRLSVAPEKKTILSSYIVGLMQRNL